MITGGLSFSAWGQTSQRYRIKTEALPVEGTSVKVIVAEAHYPEPAEKIWQLIENWSTFPHFIPRCEAVDVLKKTKFEDQIYLRMDLPIPMPDLWNVLEIHKKPKTGLLEWKMISGNMDKNTGSMRLRSEGKGTLMQMEVHADPGLFLPGWLITWGAKKYLPKVLRAIGDRLHQIEIPKPAPSPALEKEKRESPKK